MLGKFGFLLNIQAPGLRAMSRKIYTNFTRDNQRFDNHENDEVSTPMAGAHCQRRHFPPLGTASNAFTFTSALCIDSRHARRWEQRQGARLPACLGQSTCCFKWEEEFMMRRITAGVLLAAACLAMPLPAFAAEPIEGTWLRPSTGTLVNFAPCGGGFCGTVQNGEFRGQSIGTMSGSGANYTGSITDLAEDKTYRGKAAVNGNSMKLEGCVLAVLCRGETWARQ
jgi:uncharacterized protein (DUF2147 family)